jgi:hypothetical protein
VTSGALLDNPPATDAEQAGLFWLSDNGLVGEFLQVRRQVAVLEARSAALLGEIERRGVPEAEGFGSITGWLVARTGDPAPVCRSRVGVARALRGMPVTREAFAAGELSECRVRLLAAACQFSPEVFCRDEGLLVNQARTLPARLFPQTLAHWRRLADADGALADADRAFERRRLHVSATWAGMVRLDGDLDAESGAVVITALGSLADPAALDPEDRRNPAQRRADALVEICRRHLDCADRPRVGGERRHLSVTVDLESVQSGASGLADLDTGPVTLEALRRLACDASATPVATAAGAERLHVGRRSRVVPAALRRALTARDGGCTHPGCDIPARWCDAHHLTHWAHGGTTEPAELQLLCRRHHRLAHQHQPYPQRE